MTVIQLSEDALRDFQDGYSFYEAQEQAPQPGLSLRLFYTHEREMVVIWAVIDLRRDSDWIHEYLGDLRQ